MAISKKKKETTKHEEPLKIKGEFLDVFKVVKKNKEQNLRKKKKK